MITRGVEVHFGGYFSVPERFVESDAVEAKYPPAEEPMIPIRQKNLVIC